MQRVWKAVDAVAHFLYQPTALGRGCVRSRWHSRIRLIPGRLLEYVCARRDAYAKEPE